LSYKRLNYARERLEDVAAGIYANNNILMEFRIADTFTDSLARLTGDEQKAVKTTAFDLQLNPTGSGLAFHKLAKANDKNFWSVRVPENHAGRPQLTGSFLHHCRRHNLLKASGGDAAH
jgi:hypothetical protein